MAKKSHYHLKNWSEYNRALVNRGNLTVWISDEAIAQWNTTERTGKKGRPHIYHELAVDCALTVRALMKLPLRQTQGFLEGLFKMLGIRKSVPSYPTISRRSETLKVDLEKMNWTEPVNLLIDATGLKVFGEGEWKMRVHGKSKRRTWRKIHFAFNRETKEVEAVEVTKSNVHDSMETGHLLGQVTAVGTVTGDKGYDNIHAYGPIAARNARAIIPPRSGAAVKTKNVSFGDAERNRIVKEQHFLGKKLWRSASKYSMRSNAEGGISRFKRTFGSSLRSKKMATQKTEVRQACKLLNRMTHLGMPKSYKA